MTTCYNFHSDSCKLPTEEIMGVQKKIRQCNRIRIRIAPYYDASDVHRIMQ